MFSTLPSRDDLRCAAVQGGRATGLLLLFAVSGDVEAVVHKVDCNPLGVNVDFEQQEPDRFQQYLDWIILVRTLASENILESWEISDQIRDSLPAGQLRALAETYEDRRNWTYRPLRSGFLLDSWSDHAAPTVLTRKLVLAHEQWVAVRRVRHAFITREYRENVSYGSDFLSFSTTPAGIDLLELWERGVLRVETNGERLDLYNLPPDGPPILTLQLEFSGPHAFPSAISSYLENGMIAERLRFENSTDVTVLEYPSLIVREALDVLGFRNAEMPPLRETYRCRVTLPTYSFECPNWDSPRVILFDEIRSEKTELVSWQDSYSYLPTAFDPLPSAFMLADVRMLRNCIGLIGLTGALIVLGSILLRNGSHIRSGRWHYILGIPPAVFLVFSLFPQNDNLSLGLPVLEGQAIAENPIAQLPVELSSLFDGTYCNYRLDDQTCGYWATLAICRTAVGTEALASYAQKGILSSGKALSLEAIVSASVRAGVRPIVMSSLPLKVPGGPGIVLALVEDAEISRRHWVALYNTPEDATAVLEPFTMKTIERTAIAANCILSVAFLQGSGLVLRLDSIVAAICTVAILVLAYIRLNRRGK